MSIEPPHLFRTFHSPSLSDKYSHTPETKDSYENVKNKIEI